MTGMYRIVATNEHGKDEAEVEITVLSAPGKPGGPLKVKDVTKNGCKLSWKKPEDDGGELSIKLYLSVLLVSDRQLLQTSASLRKVGDLNTEHKSLDFAGLFAFALCFGNLISRVCPNVLKGLRGHISELVGLWPNPTNSDRRFVPQVVDVLFALGNMRIQGRGPLNVKNFFKYATVEKTRVKCFPVLVVLVPSAETSPFWSSYVKPCKPLKIESILPLTASS